VSLLPVARCRRSCKLRSPGRHCDLACGAVRSAKRRHEAGGGGRVRGRTGVRKAVVGGAAVAVVGLLLLPGSGVPVIAGRPPTTSNPDPVGFPSGGPTVDAFSVRVSDLDLEVEVSVRDSLAYSDAGVVSLDRIAELDRDGGEARSDLDGSTRGARGALEPVLLALIVLKALHDQDRDRRLRASTGASAAVSCDPRHRAMPAPRLRAGA